MVGMFRRFAARDIRRRDGISAVAEAGKRAAD
jgi:hypothetical protein